MTRIQGFGLAYKAETCTGLGMQMTVKTISKCSYGANSKLDTLIENAFKSCIGERKCEMELSMKDLWTADDSLKPCANEIARRQAGDITYGPAKLYGLAHCQNSDIDLGGNKISRTAASNLIVWIDSFIMIIFLMVVFRLKWYEELVEKDRQLKSPKTEDFSIFLPTIPIDEKDYMIGDDISPELLSV